MPRFCSEVSVFKELTISGHITNVLVGLFNRNMVGQWAYLIETRFVRFLIMYSALFCHLMVVFTYARPVEKN